MKPKNYLKVKTVYLVFLFLISLEVFSTPVITNVAPTRVTIGSTITITGSGFTNDANTVVNIGGFSTGGATFTVRSRTTTSIVLLINGNCNGNVTVTVSGVPATSIESIVYVTPVIKNASSNIRINKIYTDYNDFWESSAVSTVQANQPNTSHHLLGFEYNGVTYSTGVDDAKLIANGVTFSSQYYRAFSTRGVLGTTHNQLFLAMADLIDGTAHNALADHTSPNIVGLTCYDVLVDGLNGLDLGTGVTNFNTQATVQFTSDNAQSGPGGAFFTDNIPDVLFTQIADPNGSDHYYFTDTIGNVVGTPIRITMSNFTAIGRYRLDLFSFPNNVDIATATINNRRGVDNQRTRDIRMLGLRFSDFGINSSNFDDVYSLSMAAGGGADLAFMAYNTSSFLIQAPYIISSPNPVNICTLPYSNDITFTVNAGIDGGGSIPLSYQWKKNNISISGAVSDSYTIPGPISASDFATYKVEIYNEFGAIIAASAILKLGGDPAVWDGTSWNNSPNDTRSLIFTADYNSSIHAVDTEIYGCDCTVNNGVTVTIDSDDSMILQNYLTVSPETFDEIVPVYNEISGLYEDVLMPGQPAGSFIINNKGSLIQINEAAVNEGVITYKRNATNLQPFDYVYWSSPVANFNVSGLSAYPTLMFRWNPMAPNSNSTHGNWVAASGIMNKGEGYISRVSNSNDFTVNFTGEPNNGIITRTLSGVSNPDPSTNYWNLLGNPYPSAIDAEAFLLANPAIEGTVRLWTHGSPIGSYTNPFYQNFSQNYNPNDYILYNGTASVPPGFNGYIASGQGFFVKGLSNTGTVTFNNLLRYKNGSAAYDNGQFFRMSTNSSIEKSVIWLSLINTSNSKHSSIAVGYVEGATLENDRMYDTKYNENNELAFYSTIDMHDKFIIQGRPAPLNTNDIVALGITVPSNNEYMIVIDKVSGVFEENQTIYLEDLSLNLIHDLRVSPYTFTSFEGEFNNRFNLRYTNEVLNIAGNTLENTFAYIKDDQLLVKSYEFLNAIIVYDLMGKEIANYSIHAENTNEFSNSFQHENSVYLVKIILNDGTFVTKKVIK